MMFVKLRWIKGAGDTLRAFEGWYLFGVIPLYIRQLNYKGYPEGWKP